MKIFTNLFVKAALVLVVSLFSTVAAWGDTETFSYSDHKGNGTSSSGSEYTMTGSKVSITNSKFYCGSSASYAQFYANGTTTITPASGITVTGVQLTASSTSYNGFQSSGTFTASTGSVSGSTSSTTVTWTGSSTAAFTISNNKQIRWTSIVVTYSTSGGLQSNDLSLNASSKSFDLANGVNQTFQLTNSGSANGALSYQSNNTAVATVSNTGLITAIEEGSATITVTQAASATYEGGSATCVVTVSDTRYTISDLTFAAQCGGSGVADDGASWVITSDASESTFDNTSGIHYGTNSANVQYLQLVTSDVNGTIKKVRVNARDAQASGSITVTVGGNSFQCGGQTSVIATNASSDYLFTGTGSGEIIVRIDRGNANTKAIYVKSVKVSYEPSVDPAITASNVDNLAYNATSGSIPYSVTNPTLDGVMSASTTADWISIGADSGTSIAFTCSENSVSTPRNATVTLTYTYNTNETVSKAITVTQAAAPVLYTTIPALFAAAGSSTGVLVTFDSWIVSGVSTNGKNVFVTDTEGHGFVIFDNGGGLGSVYHAGDVLSGTAVPCNLVLYSNSYAELTDLDASDLTITPGGVVSPSVIAMASLSGVNTGALVSYENLSCSINNGKYYLTDATTTLQVYNSLFAFDALESGKKYNITGVYQQYNGTKEIMPRSAADIEEVVVAIPAVTVNTAINVGAEAANGVLPVLYENFTLDSSDVIFYESDGTTPATYSWISASINGENNVAYQISANTGAARTAYFKVYALDDGANEYYSSLVTVTQAAFVYATLPFAWDNKNTPTGVTNSGVGTYTSSPYLKFDTTGDYIILKINEAPGTLTYDIMGNGFSGGTFDVETSADGSNYTNLRTYTELGDKQSVSIDNLAESVRYIKWVYTEKSSGNVALGNITLVSASQPSITVSSNSINATSAETEGTLTVTYKNVETSAGVEISWFEANGTTPASAPSWVDADVNNSFNVEYLIAENTGVERSAYFKVYGVDAGVNDVYSELVTITQAAVSYTSLPFAFDGGKNDVSNTIGLSQSGLGTDYAGSPKLKFDDADDSLLLEFNSVPGVLSFSIKGNGFSGGTFKVQTSVDGSSYTDLATYTELGDVQIVDIENLSADVRFIKWIYTEKVSGNVALGNIKLSAYQVPGTINLTGTLSDGRYWVTFFGGANRYSLPDGAQAFTVNAGKQLYRIGTDGNIIPANTAVVIISDSSSITLTQNFGSKTVAVNGGDNVLQGSSTEVSVSGITGTPYVLGIVGGKLGFYEFTGANIPANKAYYVVE